MWSTLLITSLTDVESTVHCTGVTKIRGKLVGHHARDMDTGQRLFNEDGSSMMAYFYLADAPEGVKPVKKVVELNPAGAIIDTLDGVAPKKPAAKKPAARKAPAKKS